MLEDKWQKAVWLITGTMFLLVLAFSMASLINGQSSVASVLILIAQVLVAVVTVDVLSRTARTAQQAHEWAERNHQREMIQDFGRRYQELLLQQSQGNVRDFLPYFRAFWSLQFEQYRMWLSGFVPDRTYRYWLEARWRDFRSDYRIYTRTQLVDLESLRSAHEQAEHQSEQEELKAEYIDARHAFGKTWLDGWDMIAGENSDKERLRRAAPGWGSSSFYDFIEKLREHKNAGTLLDAIEALMHEEKLGAKRDEIF